MIGEERLVCVDPGLLTGVALLRRVGNDVQVEKSAELSEDELAAWLRIEMYDWQGREAEGVDVTVVVEQFFITAQTAKNSQAPWSLENIGITKQVLRDECYPVERVYWQKPSAAKSVVPNEKLQRLKLWHRGGAGHANDAIRHGVLCLIKRGWVDPRMLRGD